jgi:hypothetical protein
MEASCNQYRFMTTAYAGASSPQIATLMQNCPSLADAKLLSVGLHAEHKGFSAQLFYMLVLP